MKRERRNLFHKAASLMLAVVMVFSVIIVMPKDVRAANMTIPSSGGAVTIMDDQSYLVSRETSIISYTAAKDGYLQLTFSNATQITVSPVMGYSWGDVTFCNASGTPLATTFSYATSDARAGFYSDVYGVKKGTTYQIRVTAVGGVTISAKFSPIKNNLSKNTKKKKAITLKQKKFTDGVIQAGTTTTHWYKFKVTKAKKISVGITPKLTGSVKMTITGPGIKRSGGQVNCRYVSGDNYYLGSWGSRTAYSGMAKPGTYYIQIKPTSKTCTGYYKVNWK